ncbi:hypothetical protein [Ectopseudomonas oleovorans]|uniref:hypothetical protein n=1 Tax=Ectopseudomonas oleovorans TaxID=301 RepID=UPI001C8C629A|nr:hypothetical protein [Pseudomonas oleovorans]
MTVLHSAPATAQLLVKHRMFYYIKQAIATLRAIYWRRYLQGHGWYRMDARGNKEGVNAQFLPPKEHLAFPIQSKNERDLPEIWAEPLDIVIRSSLCVSVVVA